MTPTSVRANDALIAAIHESPRRGVLTVTGGGSGVLSELLGVAGASATVLEANVPYAESSLRDWLGFSPTQACSDETARALAVRAFVRATELGGDFGFAATASRTVKPKRGEHRAHLAFHDAATTRTWDLTLEKGAGSRADEERTVTQTAVTALAAALEVGAPSKLAGAVAHTKPGFSDLMLGSRSHVATADFDALLPGAFNPLHEGHSRLRSDAARRLGGRVGYELCIANVDKPPLDYIELNGRLAQFDAGEIVVTNAPTFLAKARALGATVFVVGTDTLERVASPEYYGGLPERDDAIREMADMGCSFLVYGRADGASFQTLDGMTLPEPLAGMCTGVPEAEFRIDISSTALREGRRH